MDYPRKEWLLCFDFDGTLIDPKKSQEIDPSLQKALSLIREKNAAIVINTGRSLMEAAAGIHQCRLDFQPDYIIALEREIYEPNKFKRWVDLGKWNIKCRKDHVKLLKKQRKFIEFIRGYVETETKARWVASQDEPAAIIATSDQEMDAICSYIDHQIIEKKTKFLSYERNTIYLRFSHSEYNKGTAAVALAKMLEITKENTFVIGDNYNDLKMLNRETAGMIACPANSVPIVKERIDKIGGFVASKDYGAGTAEALNHFFKHILKG